MTAPRSIVAYTETEIRSFLPSGWGLLPDCAGRWDNDERRWTITVRDGADNSWEIFVDAAATTGSGRLAALQSSIERIIRKALGRKSVISG